MKKRITENNPRIKRRGFLGLSLKWGAMPLIGEELLLKITQPTSLDNKDWNQLNKDNMEYSKAFAKLVKFPFLDALFGRRARRFGLGMEIPTGPLAYKSVKKPIPLSETEQMLLVAAATGVSGWNFGVPFTPVTPHQHADLTLRFTGRTAPTAAGIGSTTLFFTDDKGCYCTQTRDIQPEDMRTYHDETDALEDIISLCKRQTTQISNARLDLPSAPPHILPPNLWWANKPGSTLFMPMADTAEECLGILALLIRHGAMVVDEETGNPAGNLAPFVRSGLIDSTKRFPIAELLTIVSEGACLATGFKGHNMALMLQAIGLGGLYFSGIDDMSVMGARINDGIKGLGFDFVEDDRWLTPNPVGLKGVYEALCPPFYPDMHEAVREFIRRKFGENGTYQPKERGPWKDSKSIKASVTPYSQEFADCMAAVAQYIFDKFGKFPGLRSTMMMPGFVQAHHLDTDFYEKFYNEGAYLKTHAEHMSNWH